jgi:para-nitrobenzyl esterase
MLRFDRFCRFTGLATAALALAALYPAAPARAIGSPVAFALTENGPVKGTTTDSMYVFRGIPYAAPPVGDQRWRPPQPAKRWRGVRDATQFAGHCAQPESVFGRATTNEDCLYLNVYVPRPKTVEDLFPALRPVMVWFHGGALFLGESDEYDPTRLVEQGVVVVTVNYRLGLLGFLAHPALTAESSYGGSGDYGIMDQQAALNWVQRNIVLFGGDLRNVTIFGESAGGLSVHTHLASPGSAGLFDQAIIESGAYALTQASLATAEAAGQNFATAAGCPDQTAACLRAAPVESLLAAGGAGGFTPNIDNNVLTQTVRNALTTGTFNQVPLLEGSNHDEWRLFVGLTEAATGVPLTAAGYPAAIAATLRISLAQANLIAFLYPLAAYPSPSVALGAVGTDAIFACNSRVSARLASAVVPTFAYEFNDPNAPQRFLAGLSFPTGAYHASEIQYLFDTASPIPSPGFTPDQQALADSMVKYWTTFAKSGDPNDGTNPAWAAYTTATDTIQSLAPAAIQPTTAFKTDHKCNIWAPTP